MRAVNLIPSDLRRAGAGGGSGSGAGAYGLLAVLALAVLLVGAWAYTTRDVKNLEADVTRLNAEAAAAEQQAANLSGYQQTVKVADERRTAVVDLIKARFDWAAALGDVARTVPEGVSLASMTATVAPGVSVEGGATNPLRAAVSGPAIEIEGCTPTQQDVAVLMSRLRAMKGVKKVGLSASEKTDTSDGGGAPTDSAASGADGDCTAGSDQRPRFKLVVFYGEGAATDNGVVSAAATPASTTSTTETGDTK